MPPVIVVGSGRGGTSAVAGVLHILGVDMGSTEDGYNEDYEMWNIERMPEALEFNKTRQTMWGWKDVNFVFEEHRVQPFLPEGTRYVVVTRKPEKVVESLLRHDLYSREAVGETIKFAMDWQWRVANFLRVHPESFNVGDFDEFRENPDQVIEQLADWLPGDKSQIDRAKRYIATNDYIDPEKVI